jgi:hypothetical protein
MELTNTGDFSADKLGGVDFSINGVPLPEKAGKNKDMSCSAQIISVFFSAGIATTYTCSLAKTGMKRRK